MHIPLESITSTYVQEKRNKNIQVVQNFLRLTHVTCRLGELKHLILLRALGRVLPECFDDEERQQYM